MNKRSNVDQQHILQIQQKNIYYKSEITKHLNKINELQKEMDKEKLRNKYLQEKLREAQQENMEKYQKEIYDLKNKVLELEVAVEEEKNNTNDLQKKLLQAKKFLKEDIIEVPKQVNFFSHFQYTVLMPNEKEEDNTISIIGNFIISNVGTLPITNIIICFKVHPISSTTLSGQIAMNNQNYRTSNEDSRTEEWVYALKDWKQKIKKEGEYWIRPTLSFDLSPDSTLTFPNFTVSINAPRENKSFVEAFVYCKEWQEGKQATNSIFINYL